MYSIQHKHVFCVIFGIQGILVVMNKIKLRYLDGHIFVYDIDDWATLRKSYRIVGNIIGSTHFIPSLPTKLLPEEALLLLDKNLAEVYKNSETCVASGTFSDEFEDKLLQTQQQEYKEIRKAQLLTVIDKIVEKRRKLGDERSKEDIFNDELNKSSVVIKENMIWPIILKDTNQSLVPLTREHVSSQTTSIRTAIFRNLWERGYYVTSGEKFGGDFLVYFGDPIVHHAIFIVKCIDPNRTFTSTELIAFGRLGVSVKKRAVLATAKNNEVTYLTINWIDA